MIDLNPSPTADAPIAVLISRVLYPSNRPRRNGGGVMITVSDDGEESWRFTGNSVPCRRTPGTYPVIFAATRTPN